MPTTARGRTGRAVTEPWRSNVDVGESPNPPHQTTAGETLTRDRPICWNAEVDVEMKGGENKRRKAEAEIGREDWEGKQAGPFPRGPH